MCYFFLQKFCYTMCAFKYLWEGSDVGGNTGIYFHHKEITILLSVTMLHD